MPTTSVFAPAKINLTLHVTGQRSDGYHLLDSLVAFAPVGDTLDIAPGQGVGRGLTLTVSGPEAAGVPVDGSNLVCKAAALAGRSDLALHLHKSLPAASGIGGGSSDAAAVLRGLGVTPDPQSVMCLGADVAMCLTPHPQRVQGIGETLTAAQLPALPALLVNPRIGVPTPAVFKTLSAKTNAPMPSHLPSFAGTTDCIDWLSTQRNDLQTPAIALAPEIGAVLGALTALPACRLARMSGSGATCFALFETQDQMQDAETRLRATHSDWWIAAGVLGDQSLKAKPVNHA
ncbi:4-(cytidine 5'-diphospho)-2-C-methyl-D-erythritol kinase [Thioclava sp.]|uniref:4-(cytidine 5'-diphospho)-2-C-methyl-D-erythritol kinase n=1 Tax=Thioclava sp. TaxID=1933450 RepID=UPI003AA8EC62